MSDNRRVYSTITTSMRQLFPTEPKGNQARRLTTLAAIVEYRGSATSCRMRFAILSWTINGCETTSAGRYSTADGRLACASTAQQALRADAASAAQAQHVVKQL